MCLTKLLPALLFCTATITISYAHAFNLPPSLAVSESRTLKTQPSDIPPSVIQSKIIEQYSKWEGTHYRFGGHSHRGIDCSALMQELYRGVARMELPRTTGEQIRKGYRIAKDRLRPGDLVFFKTSPKTRHVGVYVGNNEFIHASKMKGVTISNLDNSFWTSHYETSRRVLPDV